MTDEEIKIITEKTQPSQILHTDDSITLLFEKTGKKTADGFHLTIVTFERRPEGKYRVIGHHVMWFLSAEEDYEKNKAVCTEMLRYFEVKQQEDDYSNVYRDIDLLDNAGTEVFRMLALI